jgi:hypothetical protein
MKRKNSHLQQRLFFLFRIMYKHPQQGHRASKIKEQAANSRGRYALEISA